MAYKKGTYAPPIPRLERSTRLDENGCWVWTASLSHDGYGQFCFRRRMRRVHRVTYELFKGPIPDGLVIDHLCRNLRCVNPEHLEAVTHKENTARGLSAPRKQCPHGHPYNEENTYIERSTGRRRCRTCMLASEAKRNAKRRAQRRINREANR
jgi:hypothetical protein